MSDDETQVDEAQAETPASTRAARRRLDYDKHRDWVLIFLAVAIVLGMVWLAKVVSDAVASEQETRETALTLAEQVQAECDDPQLHLDLAICQQAKQIIEDPENAEVQGTTVIVESTPGPTGAPGKDATILPEQLEAAVAKVLPALLEATLPGVVEAYLIENPPPPGPEGPRGPMGSQGDKGDPGVSTTCPGGTDPIIWTYPGTANLGLPEARFLLCLAD